MTRKQNNRYLGKVWVLPILLGLFLTVQMSMSFSGPSRDLLAPFLGAGFGVVLVLVIRVWSKRRVERAFLEPGPETLLRLMSPRGLKATPSGAAWAAYLKAWVLTLYGRFEPARAALGRIAWKDEPPLVQASATSIEALLCFFETRDFARGFELARNARAAAEVSSNFPGAKTAIQSYDVLVEIGRALTGAPSADTIANLQAPSRDLPIGVRLIATWGLAVAYAQAGDMAQANEALARCKVMAPYCKPLCSLPEPVQRLPS